MIRAGLLGAARIAPKAFITPAKARGDIDIVAVGSRSADKAQTFIAQNALPKARAVSYEAVCTDPSVDIVYCALPPAAHLEFVSLALENGKAVLCEKPFSMTADEAQIMADISARTGVFLMEGYHYFFHPAFKFLSAQIAKGAIGDVTGFRGEFSHPIPNSPGQLRYLRALGGGALMDLGCYPLHAFRQLIGEPDIVSASAVMTGDVDSAMTAQVKCGDVPGEIICDMGPQAAGVVHVELGARTAQEDGERVLIASGQIVFDSFVAPQNGHNIAVSTGGQTQNYEIEGLSSYAAQLEAFVTALGDSGHPLSPADSVLQMRAIDEIYAKSGLF